MPRPTLVKFSEMKFNQPTFNVLESIIQRERPVLFVLDPRLTVWGIDSKLYNLTEEIAYREETLHRFKPNFIRRSDIGASKHMDDVKYVRLFRHDIETFNSVNKSIYVTEIKSVYKKLEDGQLQETDHLKTKSYLPHDAKNVRGYNPATEKLAGFIRHELTDDKFKFIFTKNNIRELRYFNSPLDDVQKTKVDFDDLYVFYDDVRQFIVNPIDEIEADSDFFIEEKYRGLSLLDELAVFAHRWYQQKKVTGNRGLKKALQEKKIVKGEKKAATAAFFLSKAPKGDTGRDYSASTTCQFPFLVKALEIHVNTASSSHRKNSKVCDYLLSRGISEDNAKYGELLSRPTKKIEKL